MKTASGRDAELERVTQEAADWQEQAWQMAAAEKRAEELEDRRMLVACGFSCGWGAAGATLGDRKRLIQEHVAKCPSHPMRDAEALLAEAREVLDAAPHPEYPEEWDAFYARRFAFLAKLDAREGR